MLIHEAEDLTAEEFLSDEAEELGIPFHLRWPHLLEHVHRVYLSISTPPSSPGVPVHYEEYIVGILFALSPHSAEELLPFVLDFSSLDISRAPRRTFWYTFFASSLHLR